MAHRLPQRGRRDSQRRKTVWIQFVPAQTTIAAASTAVIISSLNAAALALRPFTVVRTRGLLNIRSDQAAASETYGCGYGLAVVSDQASAIGVTAVPTPVTDYGSDLFFMIEQVTGRLVVGAAGIEEVGKDRMLDSKAMRKVDIGQDIVLVAETASFQASCVITDSFRLLVKLH